MITVALPDLISNSYFPAIAAVELGFFKEEGLAAEIQLIFPVPRTMEALRDGEVDFVAGCAHAPLQACPEWKGLKLLAALAQRMYWLLVVRSDLQPKRGDLNVIKGLRIGAAPGPDLGFKRLLVEAGLDEQRDSITVMPVPPQTPGDVSFGVNAAKALENGQIDGFWANAMGAEVAVQRGTGSVVLDIRRGLGPEPSWHYTFSTLVTTEAKIAREPEQVAAAVRALVRAQRALREDPERATEVGRRVFPPLEASLIAELIRRDVPYLDPTISTETVERLNQFARDAGLLSGYVPYEQVVATQFSHLWRG